MATLTGADANLNPNDQKKILAAKDAYAKAQAAGDDAGMKQANADAEAVRIANGYYGGASGNSFTTVGESSSASKPFASHHSGYTNIVDRTDVSSLSAEDRQKLSYSDQQAIAKLKEAYANATDQGTKDYIHSIADTIRSKEHYSMGETGNKFSALAYGQGGRSAEEMKQWVSDYMKDYTNYGSEKYYGPHVGWTNGYSVAMNTRSIANMIRQQMDANEKAMNDSNRQILHEQNMELAKLLNKSDDDPIKNPNGKTKLLTYYNPELGRWETSSGNLGYGYDLSYTQPNIRNDVKNFYGYTDEEMEAWANDTSRYYNFVDTDVARRNAVDESSGYTGQYAQFVNGPYALTGGTGGRMNGGLEQYEDVHGDGFMDEEFWMEPKYDENGNIIKQAPALKYNNNMSAYQAQKAPIAASGVLSGRGAATPLSTEADPHNAAGQRAYYENYGQYSKLGVPFASSGNSGSGYEGYINQMYDAALQAQMDSLKSSYDQNISELDANVGKVNDTYREQKRQTTGTNAQEAANWRELANAYGLNTGAVGQAALAQNNQLQSNLNTLEQAEAAALAEIDRQKALLGQQYQLQINQALSENNFNKAQALYQEAVRAEEALTQKQQFASQMMLQYAQLAQSQSQYESDLAYKYAAAGIPMPGGSDPGTYIPVPGGIEDGDPNPGGLQPEVLTSRDQLTSQANFILSGMIDRKNRGYNWDTLPGNIWELYAKNEITLPDVNFMLDYLGYDHTQYYL